MLRSDLCDFSDAYIFIKGKITVSKKKKKKRKKKTFKKKKKKNKKKKKKKKANKQLLKIMHRLLLAF